MDSIRGFASANRSMIVNGVYIIAFLIAAYYLYKFLTAGSDLDIRLSGDPQSGTSITTESIFQVTGMESYPKCRIRAGGEFTVSMWLYISSYDANGSLGKPKPVFTISDTEQPTNHLMVGVLYPNENKMLIRAYTGDSNDQITKTGTGNGTYQSLTSGSNTNAFTSGMPQCDIQDIDMQRWINLVISVNGRIMDVYMDGKLARSCILPNVIKTGTGGYQSLIAGSMANAFTSGMPQCDIQDIDMQRWINLVISVNGRIMDVYMDGKLARSCILPNVIRTGTTGIQRITLGGFPGEFSKVRYINYAATPDQIYSIYQEGPYKSKTIVNYVGSMLGINFLYTDAQNQQKRLFG